ncbi:MAG: DegT/DnrJ/EryC1/StrS family aminotransferase, partial [Gemmatimonadales bacterium]
MSQARSLLPVRLQPVLPLGTALGGGDGRALASRPFPLDQPGVALTYSGTVAVYQAFRALPLPAGGVALCPSYNCGHEIAPLTRLGMRIRCYRVTPDLEADLEDIERRMDGAVKALLVTHFFGFGQRLAELRALCDRQGVFLIEDCAHALLSDSVTGDLGRVGDAAIYSIRKTLPLPNGGAVLFNNPAFSVPGPLEPPPKLTTWLKALDLAKKSPLDGFARDPSWRSLLPLAATAPLAVGSDLLRRVYPGSSTDCYDPDDDDFNFGSRIMSWSMSAFSRSLLDRIDWSGIAARRLSNYRFLAEALRGTQGCQVVRPQVPNSTAPLFLPVLVSRRNELFRFLRRQRIHSAIWWDQRHPAVNW